MHIIISASHGIIIHDDVLVYNSNKSIPICKHLMLAYLVKYRPFIFPFLE